MAPIEAIFIDDGDVMNDDACSCGSAGIGLSYGCARGQAQRRKSLPTGSTSPRGEPLHLLFHALDDAQRPRQLPHPEDWKLVSAVTAAGQDSTLSVPEDLDPMIGQALFSIRSADIKRLPHFADCHECH